jgi:hypothetical protein
VLTQAKDHLNNSLNGNGGYHHEAI